jgi:hypothetical protein
MKKLEERKKKKEKRKNAKVVFFVGILKEQNHSHSLTNIFFSFELNFAPLLLDVVLDHTFTTHHKHHITLKDSHINQRWFVFWFCVLRTGCSKATLAKVTWLQTCCLHVTERAHRLSRMAIITQVIPPIKRFVTLIA